jgi:hypothetical protein
VPWGDRRAGYCRFEMFVSDLRHFLDMPDGAPGPARKMAEHLGYVVRAATSADAGSGWVSALTCRRRPGNRPCQGRIAVLRADLPAPIEWRCISCGDEGVISGWEESPLDLRRPKSGGASHAETEVVISDEVAATLRDLQLVDNDCERLVFQARASTEGIALPADAEDLDELMGFVAAEANRETNRRRQKRLDVAFAALSDGLEELDYRNRAVDSSEPGGVAAAGKSLRRSPVARHDPMTVAGRWRIIGMDVWDRDALDLVAPAFIEFGRDGMGDFWFIAVRGWMDCRHAEINGHPGVEFTWDGTDEGDQVSGRGWATLQDDGLLHGHIYFHHGDDSRFRARRVETQEPGRRNQTSSL